MGLLQAGDPAPVLSRTTARGSRFVITCEHAGRAIPQSLGDLGLDEAARRRHIAWDIGAAETAQALAERLDADLVAQHYSRLVIDCNRPAEAADSIPETSDGTAVPGNRGLTPSERDARYQAIHRPFHTAIESALDRRRDTPILVAFHSFTPALAADGIARPWDLGLLYNRDDRMARCFDKALSTTDHGFTVAHNEPYEACDQTDYTLPVHGESRGIPHLLLEVRNDHLSDTASRQRWARFLADTLSAIEPQL